MLLRGINVKTLQLTQVEAGQLNYIMLIYIYYINYNNKICIALQLQERSVTHAI